MKRTNIRLLVFADDPAVPTGFGEVSRAMLSYLHKTGDYDIHLCALNWTGDEHDKKDYPYRYYRVAADLRGIGRTPELIRKVEPNCVFLLNDPDWLFEYFKHQELREVPTVIYSPIDGYPFPVWWLVPFRLATKAIVYTKWARDCIRSIDPDIEVEVVPHGYDHTKFFPVDKQKARAALGLKPDWFIVLRVDRNTERKDWGATFEVFSWFAKDKPETRLYAHCVWENELSGWVIPDLIEMFGLQGKVINTRGFDSMRKTVSAQALNLIYNAADVFLSTSKGEGWGLTIHQARACGVPVLVPNHSSLPEVVGDGGELIDTITNFVEPNGVVNALCDKQHALSLLEKFYRDEHLRQQYRQDSLCWAKTTIWDLIVPEFDRIIKEAIQKFPHRLAEVKRWEMIQVEAQ